MVPYFSVFVLFFIFLESKRLLYLHTNTTLLCVAHSESDNNSALTYMFNPTDYAFIIDYKNMDIDGTFLMHRM